MNVNVNLDMNPNDPAYRTLDPRYRIYNDKGVDCQEVPGVGRVEFLYIIENKSSFGIYNQFNIEFTVENVTNFLRDKSNYPYKVIIREDHFEKLKALAQNPDQQLLIEYYFDAALDILNQAKKYSDNRGQVANALGFGEPTDKIFNIWKEQREKRLLNASTTATPSKDKVNTSVTVAPSKDKGDSKDKSDSKTKGNK